MKKSSKQLKLTRQTVRRLSGRALDGVRGGTDLLTGDATVCCNAGTHNCTLYTGACAQSDRCTN